MDCLTFYVDRSVCYTKGLAGKGGNRERWKATPGVHAGDDGVLGLEGVMSCVWV